MTILLAGASGLVGSHLVAVLPSEQLHLVVRRAIAAEAHQSIDVPENWPAHIKATKPTIAISTLGTTIKQAGSQAAFRAVDFDLIVSVAAAAKSAGARQFIMVSSVGASARASNFYLKTKGEAEDTVKSMGFDRVDILRPGLLKGNRTGPARPVEAALIALTPITDALTPAVLNQYRSIEAQTVAKAIVRLAEQTERGDFIHHNAEMLALASGIS
jgi:uncharacterized protein YbjT (DUF2867 family)